MQLPRNSAAVGTSGGLAGTPEPGSTSPRSLLSKFEQSLTGLPWQQARADVRVKRLAQEGEVYVVAESRARRAKEKAMRRRKLRKLWDGLKRLEADCRDRDRLLERITVLKHEAGRAALDVLTMAHVQLAISLAAENVHPKHVRPP